MLQDPGRAARTSPLAVLTVLPPTYPSRRPPRAHNIEANTWLQHPLSTLHERRCRRPCKTRFRLAGCAFAGRVSNPLDRFERFQGLHSILLSRASPVARVVYAKPPFGGPEAVLAYLSRYTHRVAISNRRLTEAATREGQSHLGYLEALLAAEMEERESRAITRLLHEVRLPRMKTLEAFEFDRSGVSAAQCARWPRAITWPRRSPSCWLARPGRERSIWQRDYASLRAVSGGGCGSPPHRR
jgi:hypothetical protein